MNPAAHARAMKIAHPDRYCVKCLWNTARSGPCPRHPVAPEGSPLEEADPSEAAKYAVCDPNISPSITE